MPPHSPDHNIHIGEISPAIVALLRNVAEEAASKSGRTILVGLGLNPDNPIESQACFVRLREMVADPESRADQDWTKRSRRLTQGAFGKAIFTAVSLGVIAGMQFVWTGAKTALVAVASAGSPPAH